MTCQSVSVMRSIKLDDECFEQLSRSEFRVSGNDRRPRSALAGGQSAMQVGSTVAQCPKTSEGSPGWVENARSRTNESLQQWQWNKHWHHTKSDHKAARKMGATQSRLSACLCTLNVDQGKPRSTRDGNTSYNLCTMNENPIK